MKKLRLLRHGSVLPLLIIAIVLLSVIGVGMLRLGLQARTYAARTANEIAAQVAADAGLQLAVHEMNTRLADIQQDPRASFSEPVEVLLPNSEATYSYYIDANGLAAAMDSRTKITSIGRAGFAEKQVYALMELNGGPFEYAVFAQSAMVLKPNTIVDAYDSRSPGAPASLKIATNSTKNASVTVGKGAVINGDVVVGFGADPDAVISADKAKITGTTTAMSEQRELYPVSVPVWLRTLRPEPTIRESIVVKDSGAYSAISLDKGGIVTIDASVTLYITGDIGLGNSAAIEINDKNPDASLTLYLAGNLYSKNGGMINNLSKDPTRLRIYALDSCDTMSFATAGVFYGAIYAPETAIYLKSALEIYGSIVADVFAQGSTSNFHYDAALGAEQAHFWPRKFEIERWWEL
ncbi:MAG: hypothetical protein JW720_14080 [Sedimentisphaerales bacterium]|nr:hypothetical protein [Sedimentisphaerales bacterium]